MCVWVSVYVCVYKDVYANTVYLAISYNMAVITNHYMWTECTASDSTSVVSQKMP